MKFSLRTLLFLVLITAIFLSGLINPVVGRRNAKKILNQCSGLWWRTDSDEIDQFREMTLLNEILTEWDRLAIEKAVISPIPNQDHLIKRFLSQHRGLRGLESLSILSYESISPKSYHPIHGLRDLRFLRIKDATLDRQFFKSVAAIEDLEKLVLIDCKFDAADLAKLAPSKHLAWVHIDCDEVDMESLNQARRSLDRIQVTQSDFDPTEL